MKTTMKTASFHRASPPCLSPLPARPTHHGNCQRNLRLRPCQTLRLRTTDAATHMQSQPRHPKSGRRKTLNGPCVVLLEGSGKDGAPVTHYEGVKLHDFLAHSAEHFDNITLPLGGKLTRVSANKIEIVIPRITLLDIWLQPRAMSHVHSYPDCTEITCGTGDCILDGSHHVRELKLNERYNLDVLIKFTWDEGSPSKQGPPRICIDGRIAVEVDIPAPFSFMPQPALKACGDTAIATVLKLMMPAFLEKLTQEYNRWAAAQAAAHAGAAAAAAAAAASPTH